MAGVWVWVEAGWREGGWRGGCGCGRDTGGREGVGGGLRPTQVLAVVGGAQLARHRAVQHGDLRLLAGVLVLLVRGRHRRRRQWYHTSKPRARRSHILYVNMRIM